MAIMNTYPAREVDKFKEVLVKVRNLPRELWLELYIPLSELRALSAIIVRELTIKRIRFEYYQILVRRQFKHPENSTHAKTAFGIAAAGALATLKILCLAATGCLRP